MRGKSTSTRSLSWDAFTVLKLIVHAMATPTNQRMIPIVKHFQIICFTLSLAHILQNDNQEYNQDTKEYMTVPIRETLAH